MSIIISAVMVVSISVSMAKNVGEPSSSGILGLPLSKISAPSPQIGGQPSSTSSGSGGLADSPWPMFRQNLNHTGLSPYDTSENNGQLKWNYMTGGGIRESSPAIGSDGTIYVASFDKKLYAINPDGTEKWNFWINGSGYSSPAIGFDGTIYVGGGNLKFWAINPDGTEKWNFTTGWSVLSSPAIGPDGTIYVGSSDNNFYAINPDGTERWSFTTGNDIWSSPAIGSDGTIYVGSQDHKLYAINPDGTKKWNFITGLWVDSSPAIGSDGTIYVGSRDYKLYAINPDGTENWSFNTGCYIYASSPAIGSDGTIYIGTSYPDYKLFAINADGIEKWSFKTGGLIWSSPAIGAEGTIYIGSDDGKLYALNPDGTEKWNFRTNGHVRSSPAIGFNGTIYIGSTDDRLYAIGKPNIVVNVTSHFSELNSAAQSLITVHVTDGTNPIQGATVNLASDNGGVFNPQSGITDTNGDFESIFNAPTVTTEIICRILAEASKTGYNNGSEYVDVTLNPIPWPMFSQNCRHSGLSPYDTSSNPGKVKWIFSTAGPVESSPAIGFDGTIYVGSYDNKLYAINPDGTEKWNFTTGNNVDSSPAIGSDGTIYIGSADKRLYAINPDGTEKWNFTTGNNVYSSPAIGSDGTIYVGSADKRLYAINPDGTEKWNFMTDQAAYTSPAISSDGSIYIGSFDTKLYAINPDGTEKWSYSTGKGMFSSPAIGSDDTIYIGSADKRLYAINPDGSEKWNFTTGHAVFPSPAIGSDGTIYVGSDDHKLHAINPDGTEKWYFTTGSYMHSSPAIGSDGTIYVGSWDKNLYAIGEGGTPPIAIAGPDQVVDEGEVVQFNGSGSFGSRDGQSLDSNIVALWHMNESTGNVIYDETDNHNDGTIHGASWVGGKFETALSFDGINDYVEIPDDDSLDDMLEISIETWIYIPLDTVENKVIIAKDSGTYNSSYALRFDFPKRLQFYVFNETDAEWVAYTLPSISNEWFYVVGTYDGETVRLFLNGTEVGTRNADIAGKIQNSNAQVCIGRYSSLNSGLFNGIIDEVVIRNRALSAQNILDYYNSGKEHFIEEELPPGEPAEIISYEWDFDASDGIDWDNPNATGPTPTHVYGDDGKFIVTLRVTDNDNLSATDTCNITVQNVDPTVTIESITMDVEIGLRVAGRKYNNVSMTLYEDGNPICNVSIERKPGSPNEQMAWIPVSINFSKSYTANVTYTPEDPPNVGANPVWIYIKSKDGTNKKIHHTFNIQQSKKRNSDHWNHVEPWDVDLNGHFIGLSFEITSHISDPGSDDETLTFTYGSQVVTITYLNNPPNPDPYPSPEVKPVDIMDTTTLVYEGAGTLSLQVEDDDGGTGLATIYLG
jgi:outer membrane protein assembly factor BamB